MPSGFKHSVRLRSRARRLGFAILVVVLPLVGTAAWADGGFRAEPGDTPATPGAGSSDANERALIDRIQRLAARGKVEFIPGAEPELRTDEQLELLAATDEFLKSFPESSFRDSALIARLGALAALARTQPSHLDALLQLTDEVSSKAPTGELAAENAYFAIQGFVLGARRERMSEERRVAGSMERYRAFLQDHPNSPRRPVIWASLIRNMIAVKKVDEARQELMKMEREFPNSVAVKRSKGEINRARSLGMPFALTIAASTGEKVRTKDFKGDVVLVHYWASWNQASIDQLSKLGGWYEKFKEQGLHIVGVSLDRDREAFDAVLRQQKITWPQMYEASGPESEIVLATGVVELPLVFAVDRRGVARSVGRGDDLEELLPKLLAEPAPPRSDAPAEPKPAESPPGTNP